MDVVTWWKCVIQVSILKPTSHLPRDVVFMRSYKPLQTRSGWLYYEEVFDLKTLYESSFFLFHQSRGGKNYAFLIGENVLLLLSLLLGERSFVLSHTCIFCSLPTKTYRSGKRNVVDDVWRILCLGRQSYYKKNSELFNHINLSN